MARLSFEETEREFAELACDAEGHAWMPAGGGMLICARCEDTKWADDEEGSTDVPER